MSVIPEKHGARVRVRARRMRADARRPHSAESFAAIADEAVLLLAAGRAILLQIADPGVGAGVARHSDFASRPLDRLHGTLTYLYALNYGTDDDRTLVRRLVNRMHAPVRSADGAEPPYSAFDPELQLWVAATLYDSTVIMHERAFGPLDDASLDRVYAGAAIIGTALQVPEGAWPRDRHAFAEYWDAKVAGLRVTPEARRVASQLLDGRALPEQLRPLMPLARLVTAGLLPDALRAPFGFRWTKHQERRFERTLALVLVAYRQVPKPLRTVLPEIYLRRMRAHAPR